MPRWASRLKLEVAEVRVQRLQEISEEDAKAEGVEAYVMGHGPVGYRTETLEGYWAEARFKPSFELIWGSINGKRAPWASNPWAWALTFRRLS